MDSLNQPTTNHNDKVCSNIGAGGNQRLRNLIGCHGDCEEAETSGGPPLKPSASTMMV